MDGVDVRENQDAPIGLLAVGHLFADVVYSDLPVEPRLGEEVWTSSFGIGPGGIANFSVAAVRLGLDSSIVATFGADAISALCRSSLELEGIDLSHTRVIPGWSLPVTSSLGWGGDRALVTGGTPSPLTADGVLDGEVPLATTAVAHLDPEPAAWLATAASQGTRIYADLGWDATGAWDAGILDQLSHCAAFLPNDAEAVAYTGKDTPEAAATALAERVPLCVVTRGSRGVIAIDSSTGVMVDRPALRVRAVDLTGAGDVFGAALACASTRPWSLTEQVDFACLCAAITVSLPGGAASAPRYPDLIPWLRANPEAYEPHRFDFLLEEDAAVRTTSAPLTQPIESR